MRTHTFAAKMHASPVNSLQAKAVTKPETQKTNPVQSALPFMPRGAGNAAIARALAERRSFKSDVFKGDAKLESVLNGESLLKAGDRGDPVTKVQSALERDGIPLPKFGADGAFGGETTTAVRNFQAKHGLQKDGLVGRFTMDKLDELNAGGNGPGPNPQPNPTNEVDPALESRISQIVLDYIKIVREQNQALVLLERDLRDEEKPNQPLGTKILLFLLEKAAGGVIDKLLGGFGAVGILQDVVRTFATISGSEGADFVLEEGISLVFEKLHDEVETGIKEELTGEKAAGRASLELFIDAQRSKLFDGQQKAVDQVLNGFAPKIRTAMPGPNDREQDPKTFRVHKAQDLNIAVKEGAKGASQKQYLTSLQHYAAYQAQHDLDPNAQQNSDLLVDGGTDISKLKDHTTSSSVRGILEIQIPDIEPEKGKDPVRILALHISGLSKRARETLNDEHKDKTIGELGFPRRMWDGHEDSVIPPSIDDVELMLGRNEQHGHPVQIFADNGGKAWLVKKGDGDIKEGETVAMDQVDQTRIGDIPGGIKEPG